MDEQQKRRVSIFITGVIIGSFASMLLFYFWQRTEEKPERGETVDVVVAACDIPKGDAITEACTDVRTEVPIRFVPPGTILARDLEMLVGRVADTKIENGNAIRDADLQKVE